MIVVSDTTPLNYLILIESAHVLPALFGRVYAPPAVIRELSHPRSPERVRQWGDSPPGWLTVQGPTHTDPSLKLGPGETEAIALAQELKADWVLLDERKGSRGGRGARASRGRHARRPGGGRSTRPPRLQVGQGPARERDELLRRRAGTSGV